MKLVFTSDMSGKSEKPEKSSGSKMLKKARSFRDDIKIRIKRRPSTGAQQMIPDTKAVKGKGKGGSRSGSVSEGGRDEKEDHEDDADKLQLEVEEINRTLNFIRVVMNQKKLQIIPPSASLVLETVFDVFTLLNSLLMNQESTMLSSGHNKVCQCLARFIRWADSILIPNSKEMNKDNANEIIGALADGIKELTQLCADKMAHKRNSVPKSPSHLATSPGHQDGVLKNGMERGNEDGDGVPPPLPEKRRSGSNMFDSLSSASQTSQSTTPTQSPYNSMVLNSPINDASFCSTDLGSSQSQSPRGSPRSRSPASSIGSTEDLLSSTGSRSVSSSFSRTSSESRIANFSSLMMASSGQVKSQATCEEINQLTKKINQMTSNIDDVPPPIPSKRSLNRLMSQYDNVPADGTLQIATCSSSATMMSRTVVSKTHESRISTSSTSSSQSSQSTQSFMSVQTQKSSTHSAMSYTGERASSQETYSSSETFSSTTSHSSTESLPKPPPLPPKKRHIQAYMQTFGALTQPISLDSISRHSINFYEAQWHQHQMELFQPYPRSNTISVISDLSSFSSDTSFSSGSPERFSGDRFSGIPALPVKTRKNFNRQSQVSTGSSQSDTSLGDNRDKALSLVDPPVLPLIPDLDLKRSSAPAQVGQTSLPLGPPPAPVELTPPAKPEIQKDADSDFAELNPLDDVDVSDQLIRKKSNEDGPDIRGGSVDALIVHATAAGNTGSHGDLVNQEEFIYQEAFLTTYRTFISSKDLMEKLLYRFYKFQHATDNKKRLAMNAFSLLIRVVDELGVTELDEEVLQRMMDLVYELLCQGDLMLAKALRKKVLEKCERQQLFLEQLAMANPNQSVSLSSSHAPNLLHFKSHDIAEQMTLLDAELFQKIDIPEVLLWAKEQSEELSPHLTHFTEHFNKMSYWCRTHILTQEDAKEREKFLMKFIKMMRHLRKLHNFNSYLAILSALDSAPVRRLEWQKQNMEALKEFCQLIDSSSSFRAYRKALAETEPPCIPYLGLILQDLTFINIGNQDALPDGSINFAKRWQQFNILDSMRRFKQCNYDFKKNEKIVNCFENFDHYLSEEQLWQISENIKPRGGRKKVDADS